MSNQVYRCRFKAPRSSDWFEIPGPSPEWCANEMHSRCDHGRAFSITYKLEDGKRVHFAMVEVEGHGEMVSRMYSSGIYRAGGVKANGPKQTIEDVAKRLGWERPASELLDDGWDCEEEDWT